MKTHRLSLIVGLALAPLLAFSQSQNVQQEIATKRVKSDITIPSGKTITVESGGALTINSGASVNIAGFAPVDAGYWVKTANATLTNEFALGGLSTGLVKNTVATGEPTIAVAGTDYVAPGAVTTSGLTMATSRILGRSTASTGSVEELTGSAVLDQIGSTRGSVLYRGASGWAALTPGTSTYVLTSAGAGADPAWSPAAGGGSGLFVGRSAKTGAYTVLAGDQGYLIDCTSGTFSVSFTAAATLGNGFFVAVYNSGSGTITLDPNGSETIRDPTSAATTKTLTQGQGMVLVCDGSNFLAVAQTSGTGSTGTVSFSTNTITGTTSGNTVLTTSVSNADIQLTPNGTGYVAAATRFVVDGTAAQNHMYLRNTSGGTVTIAFDTSGSSRGTCIGARIQAEDDGGFGGHLTFANKSASGNNTTTVERMRLTSGSSGGGNLLIGRTDTTGLTGSGGLSLASTTTSTTTATGALIVPGGAGIAGPLYAQQPVVARTSALSVAANQTRVLFTNEGTTSQVVFTLPTAAANYQYTFVVQDTDGLRVTAASGDTIRIAGSVSGAAGYVESATIGNTVTLVSINATEWIATAVNGTWTVSP